MDQFNHWNHIRWEFFGSISKSSSFALSCHLLLYNWQLEIKWCHTCILNEYKKKAKRNNVIQKMNFEKTEFTNKMNYFDPLSYVIFFLFSGHQFTFGTNNLSQFHSSHIRSYINHNAFKAIALLCQVRFVFDPVEDDSDDPERQPRPHHRIY